MWVQGKIIYFIKVRGKICTLFPKLHVRHEGISLYGHRRPDEGADTDLL